MKFAQILNKRQLNCALRLLLPPPLFAVVFFSLPFQIFSHGLFSLSWTANHCWRPSWVLSQKMKKKTKYRIKNNKLFAFLFKHVRHMIRIILRDVCHYYKHLLHIQLLLLPLLLLLQLFLCSCIQSVAQSHTVFVWAKRKKSTATRSAHMLPRQCIAVFATAAVRLLTNGRDVDFSTQLCICRDILKYGISCVRCSHSILIKHSVFCSSSSSSSSSGKSNKLRISPNECGHRRANKYI